MKSHKPVAETPTDVLRVRHELHPTNWFNSLPVEVIELDSCSHFTVEGRAKESGRCL